jgi:hypothetical protein
MEERDTVPEMGNAQTIWSGHTGDLDIDGRIILEINIKGTGYGIVDWIGSSGGLL